MKIYYLLFILLSSLSYLTPFTLHFNTHYTTVAGRILNLNTLLKDNIYQSDVFRNINYFNNNKSICYTYNNKHNFKYLLKDKYTYLISFDIFRYKYLLYLKSKPLSHNYTEIDIDIRRSIKYNTSMLNFNHYRKVDNIIFKYISNNIYNIIEKKKEDMSIELFKFFNNY
jgi:hypothetical protein